MKKIEFSKLNHINFGNKKTDEILKKDFTPEQKSVESSSLDAISNYNKIKVLFKGGLQHVSESQLSNLLVPNMSYCVRGCDTIQIGNTAFKPDEKLKDMPNGVYIVGRDNDCNIIFDDNGVSRKHLEIRKTDDDYIIKDLSSTNGTSVIKSNEDYVSQNDLVDIQEASLASTGNELPESVDEWLQLSADVYNRIREVGKYQTKQPIVNPEKKIEVDRLVKDINGEFPKGDSVFVFDNNTDNWGYRKVKSKGIKETDNISSRISANVLPDAEMIKQLDEFMKTGEYTYCGKKHKVDKYTEFYYKTPLEYEQWSLRQDPITFYFYGQASDEVQLALARITQPYASGKVYKANSAASWISQNIKEPDDESIKELADKFKSIGLHDTAMALQSEKRGSDGVMSSGQLEAYRQIYEHYNAMLKK